MFALIGTVTTKHGLVHAVAHGNDLDLITVCRRAYVNSRFDVPTKAVTCVWCVTGQHWPRV